MRVAHIIKATGVAGAERHLLMLLPGLAARGLEIHLILLVTPRRAADAQHPMDAYADAMASACPENPIRVHKMTIRRHLDLGLIPALRRLLREIEPDIVHTHLLHADMFGLPAARALGLRHPPKLIMTRHNDDRFRRWPAFRQANRMLWWMVSAGIAISYSVGRFCVQVEGAPASKVRVIHYGMTPPEVTIDRAEASAALKAELNLPPDAILPGMVCRLVEQKGVRYALTAFAQVLPHFPAAHLVIAGDGVQRKSLERQARTLGIANHVHFLGWRRDADRVLAALDVLLMPSLWEGFGLVMLEAMAQRVPIIGSRVSSIPEVVQDGDNGRLVPPRDPAALAEALAELLGDTALRRHMGLMGEDRLETHFSAEVMIDKTLDLYREIARR
jgi:glycosyltransferase involved in cell wall biosynthesis